MSGARKVVEVTPLQVALMGAIAAERDRRQKASGLAMGDFMATREYQALAAVGRIVEAYLDTAPEVPQDAGWILSTTKLHPDKPGKVHYEQIRCLVVHQGDVLIRWWNCEHLCWDDESADDHFCNAGDVTAWMLAPAPPTALAVS